MSKTENGGGGGIVVITGRLIYSVGCLGSGLFKALELLEDCRLILLLSNVKRGGGGIGREFRKSKGGGGGGADAFTKSYYCYCC